MKPILWSIFIFLSILEGKEIDECFKGLSGKPFELLSLILPSNPTIYNFYPLEVAHFKREWPSCKLSSSLNDQIDLIHLPLEKVLSLFKSHPQLLSSLKGLYLNFPLFPYPEGSLPFWEVKYFLEDAGFSLLSHWFKEGAEGSALFVKNSFFYNSNMEDYLKTHSTSSPHYGYYNLVVFPQLYGPVRYCLDDDKNDSVKQTLMTGYAYEGNLSRIMHALIRPGSIAIDVGAHVGAHTIFMSRKAGDTGAVIAFEPGQKLYMEHLTNLQINGCRNVLSFCRGLGDTYKKVSLRGIEIEQAQALEGPAESIEIIPLDSLKLNQVSLIKIDVENYEYFVLEGAKETILKNKPRIVLECWIGHDPEHRDQIEQKKNFARVMSLIQSFGYEIYILFNCDFLAIPIGYSDEATAYFTSIFEKLDLNTYLDDAYREKSKAHVVAPFGT